MIHIYEVTTETNSCFGRFCGCGFVARAASHVAVIEAVTDHLDYAHPEQDVEFHSDGSFLGDEPRVTAE